jgi:hypothetical protein
MNPWPSASLLVGALAALAGCASPPAVTAKLPPPPPITTQTGADMHIVVQLLVTPSTPKAWSRGSRWDEYVLLVTNQGTTPLQLESAALVDVRGQEQVTGDKPATLEKLSKEHWIRYTRDGVPVTPDAVNRRHAERNAAENTVGFALVEPLSLVLLPGPVLIGAASAGVIMYTADRSAIHTGFQQRRLKLPLLLAGGQTVNGSLFFPLTPGPQRLVITYRSKGERRRQEVPLAALARLHLPPGSPAPTATPWLATAAPPPRN